MSGRTGRVPILVGVDGSEPALDAVRWAAHEAARAGVGLRLVTTVGAEAPSIPGYPLLGTPLREMVLRDAQEHLDRAAAMAAQVAPRVEVTRDVLTGHPAARLMEETERAGLVVVGDRGLGGLAAMMVGSVAVALAGHASCPVVVVRGVPAPGGPVVVGVDGSPTSEAALAYAFEAAAARRTSLVAVHAWASVVVDMALDWDAVEVAEREVLAERLAGWGEKYPEVPVERVVTRDRPARQLVARSGEAQLVVVGSRGRGGVASLVLGSVSHALLHHAGCPVAVVRPVVAAQRWSTEEDT